MAVLPSISLSFDVKNLFFDRDRVTKFMDGQTRKALQEAGRRIRRIAQTSMRYVTSRKEQERKIAAGLRKVIRDLVVGGTQAIAAVAFGPAK